MKDQKNSNQSSQSAASGKDAAAKKLQALVRGRRTRTQQKQQTSAAGKLQALVRGRRARVQQRQQSSAAVKLQALVRGKRDRRAAALKKKKKKRTQKTKRPLIIGRTAYKSYVGSYSQTNSDKVGGDAGVQILRNFTPQIRASLSEHGGLKIHISSTALYRKSVDAVDVSDYNSMPDEALSGFWHTTHIVSVTNDSQVGEALRMIHLKNLMDSSMRAS